MTLFAANDSFESRFTQLRSYKERLHLELE